jgi:predicted dehydrogenase
MSSQARPLQVGIIGAGLMGYWHAKAIKRASGCLRAIIDTDPMVAQRLAAGYHTAECFTDVNRMLNRIQLDVLHICTPSSSHYKIAELAIDAGLHVIIEKPITTTAFETERLLDQAAARDVLLCPVHQFMFQNGVLKARELLSRIGRVIHMEGTICSEGGKGLPSSHLNEIVADILPHPLSLMQLFLPNNISEVDWVTSRPAPGELRAFSEDSAISLSILISMNARPTQCSFLLIGTEGMIHIDLFHGFAFMETGKSPKTIKVMRPFNIAIKRFTAATLNLGLRIIRWQPAYPGLQELISLFYKAARKESMPPISRDDAMAVSLTRDRLLHSTGLKNIN